MYTFYAILFLILLLLLLSFVLFVFVFSQFLISPNNKLNWALFIFSHHCLDPLQMVSGIALMTKV